MNTAYERHRLRGIPTAAAAGPTATRPNAIGRGSPTRGRSLGITSPAASTLQLATRSAHRRLGVTPAPDRRGGGAAPSLKRPTRWPSPDTAPRTPPPPPGAPP